MISTSARSIESNILPIAFVLMLVWTSTILYGQESNYESADKWNFPSDNYWVCAKLKTGSAPTRYSDGTPVVTSHAYDVNAGSSTTECGPGWIRLDFREIVAIQNSEGDTIMRLAFHKGGQGCTSPQLPYGFVSMDDIEEFDGVPQATGRWDNVPLAGSKGAGLPQVQGKPLGYGAPSWDSGASKWDLDNRNGRECTPTDTTTYVVKIIPQGSPNALPPDWQYKPDATSSRFNKYADAGPEFGDKSAHYAYLVWSWMFMGNGVTKNGGGGQVRSILRDGQVFQRSPVKAIASVAYARNSSRVVGEVTAIYVRTRASELSPWLYGWMISAHRAKLSDDSLGPSIEHFAVKPTVSIPNTTPE